MVFVGSQKYGQGSCETSVFFCSLCGFVFVKKFDMIGEQKAYPGYKKE